MECTLKGPHLSAHLMVETNSVIRSSLLVIACSFYVLFVLPSVIACWSFRQEVIFPDSCDVKPVGKNPKIVHNFETFIIKLLDQGQSCLVHLLEQSK